MKRAAFALATLTLAGCGAPLAGAGSAPGAAELTASARVADDDDALEKLTQAEAMADGGPAAYKAFLATGYYDEAVERCATAAVARRIGMSAQQRGYTKSAAKAFRKAEALAG